MPVTEIVKPLSASFEGLNGAIALSVIAFSVVFLVLIGLTVVIFAMRLVSKIGVSPKPAPAPAPAKVVAAPAAPAPAAPAPAAAPVVAAADDSDEIVAVIAAAVAAFAGSAVRVSSIVPAVPAAPVLAPEAPRQIGTDNVAWIACGRLEGLQGALPDRWN